MCFCWGRCTCHSQSIAGCCRSNVALRSSFEVRGRARQVGGVLSVEVLEGQGEVGKKSDHVVRGMWCS